MKSRFFKLVSMPDISSKITTLYQNIGWSLDEYKQALQPGSSSLGAAVNQAKNIIGMLQLDHTLYRALSEFIKNGSEDKQQHTPENCKKLLKALYKELESFVNPPKSTLRRIANALTLRRKGTTDTHSEDSQITLDTLIAFLKKSHVTKESYKSAKVPIYLKT